MKSPFWFAVTIILLVCIASAGIDWLFQPSAVQAAGEAAIIAGQAQPEPVAAQSSASPVVQVVVALVFGLFGILSLMPVFAEEK